MCMYMRVHSHGIATLEHSGPLHNNILILYQPITVNAVMAFHKPIRIYMDVLILGVVLQYMVFCLFKLFLMVGKELRPY